MYARKLLLHSQIGSFAFSLILIHVVFYPEEIETPRKAEQCEGDIMCFTLYLERGGVRKDCLRKFVRSVTREMQISPMAAWKWLSLALQPVLHG